ncbi:hypothetical protein A3L09_09170 [Thermococcus profundus]|uniref:DUF112 domain-containing protein n=1 Tax=Thermococcus profundus TaxID=49899 RepID=A0A2Z2MAL0_THEPR|nr:tripartite tricarboxylate transporter permease [Thermococcus profundus]ASJ03417.1 hypothetical protein A3L09_09170 [Thermococcus profundus]
MLWELLKGLLMGTFTGLTPGIHVNTLAGMGGSFCLLFAMGLTHTFLDTFPSTFLGVPDEGTALSILPAHKLVLAGRGKEVIILALWSSFLAVLFTPLLFPLYRFLAAYYSPSLGKAAVAFLLLFLIATEKKGRKVQASLVIVLSGILGVEVLRESRLHEPFYHLFTGLFGIPVILMGIRSISLPEQGKPGNLGRNEVAELVVFSFIGTFLGMISSLLPAFTASMGATIATLFSRGEKKFLTAVYSINTANFLFGVLNYTLTGRTRNGVVVAMEREGLAVPSVGFILISALFVGSLAVLFGLRLMGPYLSLLNRINYGLANSLVLAFLVLLSGYFDGVLGLWVLLTSAGIGYLAGAWRVRRTNCMGVLMVPILIM